MITAMSAADAHIPKNAILLDLHTDDCGIDNDITNNNAVSGGEPKHVVSDNSQDTLSDTDDQISHNYCLSDREMSTPKDKTIYTADNSRQLFTAQERHQTNYWGDWPATLLSPPRKRQYHNSRDQHLRGYKKTSFQKTNSPVISSQSGWYQSGHAVSSQYPVYYSRYFHTEYNNMCNASEYNTDPQGTYSDSGKQYPTSHSPYDPPTVRSQHWEPYSERYYLNALWCAARKAYDVFTFLNEHYYQEVQRIYKDRETEKPRKRARRERRDSNHGPRNQGHTRDAK